VAAARIAFEGRTDQADLVNVIASVLEAPLARPALSAGFESSDRYVRWFCFERALSIIGVAN